MLLWCFIFIVFSLCSVVFIVVFLQVTLVGHKIYFLDVPYSTIIGWSEIYMNCKCSSWLSQYFHHRRIFLQGTVQYWSALWSTQMFQRLALRHNDQDCTVHRNRTNTIKLYSDFISAISDGRDVLLLRLHRHCDRRQQLYCGGCP